MVGGSQIDSACFSREESTDGMRETATASTAKVCAGHSEGLRGKLLVLYQLASVSLLCNEESADAFISRRRWKVAAVGRVVSMIAGTSMRHESGDDPRSAPQGRRERPGSTHGTEK